MPIADLLVLICLAAAPAGVQGQSAPTPVAVGKGSVAALLNQWYAEGSAAGNVDDHYDNRDRGHSRLEIARFPQLSEVTYSDAERAERADWGAQREVVPHVTIGNSSTAVYVKETGSNVRTWYYHADQGMRFLYTQYRANNLYVYPEHHDHDPGHNGNPGFGDLFPTNSPYVVISQGSSGSDKPFLRAFVQTLAAFRPQVKQRLIAVGLLMPTLQAIFRASNTQVAEPEVYFTGRAHPTAFRRHQLDPLKMVLAAHALTVDAVPPLVRLTVRRESDPGRLPGFDATTEKLSGTPCVIARIVRGPAQVRRLVVSAAGTFNPGRRPLTFRWAVLRGDPERIAIRTRANGAVAELTVPCHDRRAIEPGAKLASNRVDIGVFASAGHGWSAPAFVTFYTLDNELRTYDDDGRLLEIYYGSSKLHLGVRDWSALLQLFARGPRSPAVRLFTGRFSPAEREALARIAASCTATSAVIASVRDRHEQAEAAVEEARASLKQARDRPESPERTRAIADLVEVRQRAEATAEGLRKTLAATEQDLEALLNEPQAALGGQAVRRRVRSALFALAADPGVYVTHAAWIDPLLPVGHNGVDSVACRAARARLQRMGILVGTADGWQLRSAVGDTNRTRGDRRLTRGEQLELKRFQLLMLTDVLFPRMLRADESPNFVDSRLTTSRDRRDVYHYDTEGRLTGWTRFEGPERVDHAVDR